MIEAAGQIDTICLDKTGTLTHGKPEIVAFEAFGLTTEEEVLQLALSAEIRSEHPIAKAITTYAQQEGIQPVEIHHFEQVFGVGIKATLGQDLQVWVGSNCRADIAGVAAGADAAIESAGIVLMGNDLRLLNHIIGLSRQSLMLIKQNIIGFAVGMNILGIMLAGSGILNPIMAAVMHNISSAFVVINSSRLLGFDKTS